LSMELVKRAKPLLDKIPLFIVVADKDGTIIYVSPYAAPHIKAVSDVVGFGLKRGEDVIGTNFAKWHVDNILPEKLKALRGKPWSWLVTIGPYTFRDNACALFNDEGEHIGYVSLIETLIPISPSGPIPSWYRYEREGAQIKSETIQKLTKGRENILERIQLVEIASLMFYANVAKKPRKEIMKSVEEFRHLFKNSIVFHFKTEEEAVFPVLERTYGPLIEEFRFDHEKILKRFSKFESEKEFEKSIKLLQDVVEDLIRHNEKEKTIFHSFRLSEEEYKEIDEKAKDYAIP